MRYLIVLLILATSVPAMAQVQSRPTAPPVVTAESEPWFRLREPLQFAGDVYYPAGAVQFFNGNSMVRTGHYNGVPLYADTAIEPYSVVLVPIGRGLMQPYERLREGNLAGTAGSRTPSFPVRGVPSEPGPPASALAPTGVAQPSIGNINAFTPLPSADGVMAPAVGTAGGGPEAITTGAQDRPMVSVMRPENNDGIWIAFRGQKWVSGGAAVVFSEPEFARVGDYAGFPVYTRQAVREDVVYLPTRDGLVAPYRLKK